MYPGTTLVTITAIPSPGYEFDHWEGCLIGSDNPATILVASAKTVTAVFVTRFQLLVVTPSGGGGVVTLNPPQPDSGYVAGTPVSLVAEASAGYFFDHWEGDLDGSASPAELLISENKTVTAAFLPRFQVAVDVTSEGGGTVTLDPLQPSDGYPAGTVVTVTANGDKGYSFDHWEGSLSGSSRSATVVVDAPKEILADFSMNSPFPWWWILTGILLLTVAGLGIGFAYGKWKESKIPERVARVHRNGGKCRRGKALHGLAWSHSCPITQHECSDK